MKPSIPTSGGPGRKAEGPDPVGGARRPIWRETEFGGPEVDRTARSASIAADDPAALRGPQTRSVRPRDLTGEPFITIDETGADVLVSESRTVAEVIRHVREGALRGTAGDPRCNPRTRHLRRLRHRHGHERFR